MSTNRPNKGQYKPPAGVYFLYDGSELVYVGETNDIFRRISEHSRGRVKPGQQEKHFTWWEYIEVDNENLRKSIEYMFIQIAKPKYNEDYRFLYQLDIADENHFIADHRESLNKSELLDELYARCKKQLAS